MPLDLLLKGSTTFAPGSRENWASPYDDNGSSDDAMRAAQFWTTEAVGIRADMDRLAARQTDLLVARERDREARLRAAELTIDEEIAKAYGADQQAIDELQAELDQQIETADQAAAYWMDEAQKRAAAGA